MFLPEFTNKIIVTGLHAGVLHTLNSSEAVDQIKTDPELSNLSDSDLQKLIKEAGQYWREKLDLSAPRPELLIIYPQLMEICAGERLKALGEFSNVANPEEKKAFDARRAMWITILAYCLLDQGMLFLLFDPQYAWEAFTKANVVARGLPDFGQLRLREVLWASCGQRTAASIGNQAQLVEIAEQELANLMQLPHRKREALNCLQEIQREFARIEEVHRKSRVFQQAQEHIFQAVLASSGSQFSYRKLYRSFAQQYLLHTIEPSEAQPKVMQSTDPLALLDEKDIRFLATSTYMNLLNYYCSQILTNTMQLDTAKQQLMQAIDDPLLSVKDIALAADIHLMLIPSNPDRAVTLAALNYVVSRLFSDEESQMTRAYCSFVLGRAWYFKAGQQKNDRKSSQKAILYLEEAIQNWPVPDIEFDAEILTMLVSCCRDTGNLEKALKLSSQALELRLALPNQSHNQRINLGVVYGNLASVQERLDDLIAAFENHYKAFQIFVAENDLGRTQQALHYLSNVCARTGRIDDAIAARERVVRLQVELGNLAGAAEAYLGLADMLLNVPRYQEAFEVIQQVRDLLLSPINSNDVDERLLSAHYQLLMYEGLVIWLLTEFPYAYTNIDRSNDAYLPTSGEGSINIHAAQLNTPPIKYTFEDAYAPLEEARKIAVHLSDMDRVAQAVILIARVCSRFKWFGAAEEYCGMLEHIPCTPFYLIAQDEILGEVRFYQKHYQESIELLQKALAAYAPEYRSKRRMLLFQIGRTCEILGDLEKAVQAYEASLDIFEQSRLMLYEESRMENMISAIDIYDHLISLFTDDHRSVYNPKMALIWLEKSKSRTFVEAMGLSNLLLKNPSDDIKAFLLEEAELLRNLNIRQIKRFTSKQDIANSLEVQQEIYFSLKKLNSIWDQIAVYFPEYVELRRGGTSDWSDLQEMLEA